MEMVLYGLLASFLSCCVFACGIALLFVLMNLPAWYRLRRERREIAARMEAQIVRIGWYCRWCETKQSCKRSADLFCSDACAADYERYCEEIAG